jgi:hypothetical protein
MSGIAHVMIDICTQPLYRIQQRYDRSTGRIGSAINTTPTAPSTTRCDSQVSGNSRRTHAQYRSFQCFLGTGTTVNRHLESVSLTDYC